MAVSAKLFTGTGGLAGGGGFTSLFIGTANWLTTTAATNQVMCSLHTSTYTPNQLTHKFFNQATNELTTTGGYTAGGTRINTTATVTDGTTSWNVLYANASWSSATFTARTAVVFSRGPSGSAFADSASPLLLYVDFGADQTVSSGTFTVQWSGSGTVAITVS